jgi:hypothetical protein
MSAIQLRPMLEIFDMTALREPSQLPAQSARLSRQPPKSWTGMATLAGICLYLLTCVAIGAFSHSTRSFPSQAQAAALH